MLTDISTDSCANYARIAMRKIGSLKENISYRVSHCVDFSEKSIDAYLTG
jgi:hypothetical protein